MGLFNKTITITGNTSTVVTIGDNNLTQVVQRIESLNETNVTNDPKMWGEIAKAMTDLQKGVREIPDSNGAIRDEELTPMASQLKREAEAITENPQKEKRPFLDKLKGFVESVAKVAEISQKLSPILSPILTSLGIPVPTT